LERQERNTKPVPDVSRLAGAVIVTDEHIQSVLDSILFCHNLIVCQDEQLS